MDQLSRPLLIALAAVVALAGAWTLALRPKDPSAAADAAAPAAPLKAIPKAKAASKASDAANAAVQKAGATASGDATATPAPTAVQPAPAPATKPAPAKPATPSGSSTGERRVLSDLADGKVVVLLFQDPRGADDRAVRRAVEGLGRHGGRVAIHVAPISQVGTYPAITTGVTVTQSPTTIVIGRDFQARAIVGLSEPRELSQAVGDALDGR